MPVEHTPGPWFVVPYGDGDNLVICSDEDGEWRISFMATHGGSPASWQAIQANARVIAAAPDLLEVAKSMLPANVCITNPNVRDDTIIPLDVTIGELRKIAAAIARATQEAPHG